MGFCMRLSCLSDTNTRIDCHVNIKTYDVLTNFFPPLLMAGKADDARLARRSMAKNLTFFSCGGKSEWIFDTYHP
jgi:hypothetical protein